MTARPEVVQFEDFKSQASSYILQVSLASLSVWCQTERLCHNWLQISFICQKGRLQTTINPNFALSSSCFLGCHVPPQRRVGGGSRQDQFMPVVLQTCPHRLSRGSPHTVHQSIIANYRNFGGEFVTVSWPFGHLGFWIWFRCFSRFFQIVTRYLV